MNNRIFNILFSELKCLCIKVEALKEEVKANTKLLQQILHIIKRGREVNEVELPNDIPSLPLSSMEDLTALNDALKDAAKRKYLVSNKYVHVEVVKEA